MVVYQRHFNIFSCEFTDLFFSLKETSVKHFYSLLAFAIIFISPFVSKAQPGHWKYIAPNSHYFGSDWITDITFTDTLVGYATNVINPKILKTTDGGINWQEKLCKTPGSRIKFLTKNTGWMADGNNITKTNNGGDTWSYIFQKTPDPNGYASVWDFQFLDSLNGFVVGDYNVSKTSDGGATWSSIIPWNIDSTWATLFFLNRDTGWIFSHDSIAAKTIDGGQTWTQELLSGILLYRGINGAHFYSANTGVAISLDRQIYKTFDGGNNWNHTSDITIASFTSSSIKFGNNGLVYAAIPSSNNYVVSSDTGNTWALRSPPNSNSYCAGYFFSAQKGFVGQKTISSTNDGGSNWQTQTQNFPTIVEPIWDFDYDSTNHMMASFSYSLRYDADAGELSSTDLGENWTRTNYTGLNTIKAVSQRCYFKNELNKLTRYENGIQTLQLSGCDLLFAKGKDSVIVYGTVGPLSGILRTVNGGSSWDTIATNYGVSNWLYQGEIHYSIEFLNWDTAIVLLVDNSTSLNYEAYTFNGGQSWQSRPAIAFMGSVYFLKLSPTGEIFSLRTNGSVSSWWKLNGNLQWEFVNFIGYQYYSPAIEWSSDQILWTTINFNGNPTLICSIDNGESWSKSNMELYSYFSTIKQLNNGKFVAGTEHSELLEYSSTENNCRLKGNIFYDFNLNNVKDGYDTYPIGLSVNVQPGNTLAFTNTNGNYQAFADSGSYIVTPQLANNIHAVPAARTVAFNSQTAISAGNNFILQPIDTSIRDLHVNLFPISRAAPGFTHQMVIAYSNVGVQAIQATVVLIKDSLLSLDNSLPIVSSQSGDTLFWNLPVLNPYESGMINLNFTLSLNATLGQWLHSSVLINPVSNDNTPSDNVDSASTEIRGSFDPNIKEVKPTIISANQTISQNVLSYTIHFQNTGTDTAHFIVIKDTLSLALNLATLHITASSHPYDYHVESGNILVFRFNNVWLPDSTTDEEHSHGFVSYIISPKPAQINMDTIYNAADIYFDYNPPVTTNTAKTEVDHSGTTFIQPIYGKMSFQIFPNPATSQVQVESDGDFECTLFNILGEQMQSVHSTNSKLIFSVENYSSGMYLLRVNKNGKTQGYSLCIIPK